MVDDVGPDGFEMTVDTVWAPELAFDAGTRVIHVGVHTVFDPPEWNIGNLQPGEDVAVTVADPGADPADATDVTVVDPD